MENRYEASLLPAVVRIQQTWSSERPCRLWDLVNYQGDLQLGYAFASLFVPDLVEVEGAVILAEQFSTESFQRWKSHFDDDLQAVERMMNHLHVEDIFLNGRGDHLLPEIVGRRMGEAIKLCWAATLHSSYPERTFSVTYEVEDGMGDGEVTFWQIDRAGSA